jgi:hypothetical protein
MDYLERYNQAMGIPGATSGASYPVAPITARPNTQLYDFARGVPNTLQPISGTDYFGISPRRGDTPSSLLGGVPPQTDRNAPVFNTGRTFETVRQEAEAGYLARATEQRDLARQGIQQTGADQYSQARMAMEQQRALSDTRGLTAGAREGANQMLSATQQVALNQIEAQTRSELLQLQREGVQDEFLAQEWADRKVQQFQTSSPEAGALRGLQTLYQNAANTGDVDKMNELSPQLVAAELAMFGTPQSEIKAIQDAATAGNLPELNWLVKERIRNITGNTGGLNMLVGVGATGGGILLGTGAVAKIVGAVGTAIAGKGIIAGAGAILAGAAAAGPLAVAGTVALAIVGTAAIVFGAYRMVVGAQQMFRSPERKRELLNEVLADERVRLNRLGYTNEAIDAAIDETIKNLAPIFQ